MKLVVGAILLLLSNLNATDLASAYRQGGLKSVEVEIEKTLSTKDYWLNKLSDTNVDFGYFESVEYLLTCNKSNPDLQLYVKNSAKGFEKKETISALVGKNQGDKFREGDKKTPVGVYRLNKKLTSLDQFYGPLAYVTNYPNTLDKTRGKNGSGIWIHGLPLDGKRESATKGCIAVNNEKLKNLEKSFDFKKARLIIDEKSTKSVTREEVSQLLSSLFAWKNAWKYDDLDTYISFYNKDFKHSNGKKLKSFTNYKKRVFNQKQKKTIRFSNISIMPYPGLNEEKIFLIEFDELYHSNKTHFQGLKELYVTILDKKFSILTEK